MAIYVFRGDGFYDKNSGERMALPDRDGVCVPYVQSDIPEYRSPIDGKLITSNAQRREDLRKNNCIDGRDVPMRNEGKFLNKKFVKKHNLNYA